MRNLLVFVFLLVLGFKASAQADLEKWRLSDGWMVNERGERVLLRGVNLGNWLLLEPWMFGWGHPELPSQHDLIELFVERFGEARTDRLLTAWRENFITDADFARISAFGMNVVRVPIHYSVIESVERDGRIDPDGIRYVDWAVRAAADAGLFVILDLHGAPGGQSIDAPTGRVGHNTLWSDASAQDRTVALWKGLAERYGDEPNVVLYDLLNEPYGEFNDAHQDVLVGLMDRLIREIREVDSKTAIVVPGTLRGVGFYGPPSKRGWLGVGFTEHYYPGIFGGEPVSLMHQARFDQGVLPAKKRLFEDWDSWLLVGEFNPIFERVGGARRTKQMIQSFEAAGWGTTLWSYCLLKAKGGFDGDNWYMRTNAVDWRIDPFTASYETILHAFLAVDEIEMVEDEELRALLSDDRVAEIPMPQLTLPAEGIRSEEPAADYVMHEIGSSHGGAYSPTDDGFLMVGGGHDIWGTGDSFSFLAKGSVGDDELSVTIGRFDAWHRYAKAGLMIRKSNDPGSAHVFLHVFPDGRVVLAQRSKHGAEMVERVLTTTGFPVSLSFTREAGDLVLGWRGPGTEGSEDVFLSSEQLRGRVLVGYAVLGREGSIPGAVAFEHAFELVDERAIQDSVRFEPESWNLWGSAGRFADRGLEFSVGSSGGAWRDSEIAVGESHRLITDFAVDGDAAGAELGTVELRVEQKDPLRSESMMTLATHEWPIDQLVSDGGFSRLQVDFVPPVGSVRLVIAIHPASSIDGGGVRLRVSDVAIRRESKLADLQSEPAR